MALVAPSLLSSDFSRLADEVARVEEAGADLIHVDVMDGHFVPNITVGPVVVKWLRKAAHIPLDVHLMISRPLDYVGAFCDAGADYLTIHVESEGDTRNTLDAIRDRGVKAGVTLNPPTAFSEIEPFVAEADMVLMMSVNPGWGGQKFIPETLDKVRAARSILGPRLDGPNPEVLLSIDGGMNSETAALARKAGNNLIVAGSAIFGADDVLSAIRSLRGEGETK